VLQWTSLRLSDATTHTIAGRVDSVSDDGTDWTLALTDGGSVVGDYPSRQDGWSWPVPADVIAGLAAGGSYVLVAEVEITGAAPSLATGYTITLGCADQGGDASNASCRLLGGGMRWASASIRGIATSRGGGGADVQSGSVSTTVVRSRATVMAGTTYLQGVQAVILDTTGDTDDRAVQQQDATAYTAPLRVVMYAGCDSLAGTGPHSLVFRPQVAWLRVPT